MDKSKQIGNSGMDESTKKLMKKKQGFIQLLILGAATIVLVAGVFIYKTINNEPDILGAIPSTVSSSTTINTLYTEVNNLVGFVRSSTSTLGVFGTLSTTTGNLIVASTSGGWTVLDVGTNAYVLTASSTAQSGVSWEAQTGLSGSGSANEFLLWNTITNAMGSANATFVTSTGLMTFTATTTITNLLSTSGTITGLWNTDFNSVSSTITNLRFTNASGTNITLTGNLAAANSSLTTVTSTRIQVTGQFRVDSQASLQSVSSTVLQTTGQLIIGGHTDLGAVSSTILQATGQIRGDLGLAITAGDTSLQNVSGTSATFSGSLGGANASFTNVSSTGRLWVTGTSTMTGLVVTNLTAANCDVKSGAGAFYCGLDATGGGGGGSTSTFDYVMTATGGEHPNANDPGYSKTTGSNWTRISLDFSSTTDETINYAFGLPMDIGLVGTSTFYAWSSVTSTATAAKTWVYSLKYLCSANDTAWDATGSTVNTSTVLSALGDIMLTTFNASTTDFAKGEFCQVALTRSVAGGDTAADVQFWRLLFHLEYKPG